MASRRLSQLYDEALAPVGLNATQYALLHQLDLRGETAPTLTELADAMAMDRSGLGHGLRPLEREGLIALAENPDDRRRRHIVLTEKGRFLRRHAEAYWRKAEERFRGLVGAENADRLRAQMAAIAFDDRLASIASAGDA
jgi:DNA-binding MarR family transcriptional regulator